MTTKNSALAASADREIVISRVFDAPRELVWKAWTDPEQVVRWWGPRGFTTTVEEMDVRPGGVWKHVMHGPDGTDYPNKSVFTEVVKAERIVYSNGGGRKGGPGVHFVSTWTFDVVDDSKTKVTIRHVFATAADRDRVVREFGAIEGGKQTLERLAEQLPKISAEKDFVISRVFDAPRELVWKAWTDPKHVANWWGPRDFTNPVCELDVRVGGAYRVVMRAPDGAEFPMKGVYREIVAPERLVMSMDCSEHSDEWHDLVNPNRRGNRNPAGEMVTMATFEKVGDKTRLTIRTRFESAAIRDAMLKMGMTEGWSLSLDRLAECLSRLS